MPEVTVLAKVDTPFALTAIVPARMEAEPRKIKRKIFFISNLV